MPFWPDNDDLVGQYDPPDPEDLPEPCEAADCPNEAALLMADGQKVCVYCATRIEREQLQVKASA